MSTNRRIDVICIIVMVLAVLFTVLFINGERIGIKKIADEDSETYEGNEYFTANDQNGNVKTDSACKITLKGTDGKISGNGAYFYHDDLVISGGGKYLISGELTDGSIIVDAYSSSKVWLILNGVTIHCEDDAAIRVDQADKVFLTLPEGSVNILSCGEEFSDAALSDGTGGAVFSHDDITINGSGSLKVESTYKYGFDINDSLRITGGNISVTAPKDAIHVNDEFSFTGADLVIDSGDDAIHSDDVINILGGSIHINSCYEGLEALAVNMEDGNVAVYPSDDGFNANGSDVNETYIRINGGSVTIVNSEARDADGLDSNGNIYINGGLIRISMTGGGSNSALDYGSESGGEMIITGGDVIACGSSAMAESFSDDSTQCCALVTLDETVEAGNTLTVEDVDGNILLSYDVPCSFNSINLSCDKFEVGNTYVIKAGSVEKELTFDAVSVGEGSSFGMGGPGGGGGFGPGMGGNDDHQRPDGISGPPERTGDSVSGNRGPGGDRPEGDMPNGEKPEDFGNMDFGEGGPMDFNGDAGFGGENNTDAAETGISTGTALTDLSQETYIWMAASALLLLAGIAFARNFRRR